MKGLTRWRIKNGGEWNVKVLKRWRIKNGLVMLGQWGSNEWRAKFRRLRNLQALQKFHTAK